MGELGEREEYLVCVDGIVAEDEARETALTIFCWGAFPRSWDDELFELSKRFEKCLDRLTISHRTPQKTTTNVVVRQEDSSSCIKHKTEHITSSKDSTQTRKTLVGVGIIPPDQFFLYPC